MRVRFEKMVEELTNVEAPDMWSSLKDGVLKACDALCRKKIARRCTGNTWWWNDKLEAHKELCEN